MSRPALSVVVAASDSAAAVARCLASLGRTCRRGRLEVIVAAPRDRIAPESAPPGVAWVAASAGTGVPRLRQLGLEQARGEIVAFTEDSCVLVPGWADAWELAFDGPDVWAATGPVEHAEGRPDLDWAVFFCEYAPFLEGSGERATPGNPHSGPFPRGEGELAPRFRGERTGVRELGETTRRLAGNNFAARREEAQALGDGREVHESILARAVARRGGRLVAVGSARAWHVRRFGLREALRDRLRFGREFGQLRAGHGPGRLRLLSVVTGPAILLAQVGRLAATIVIKRRYWGRFLETLPLTLALLAAWSVGEWLGWLEGMARPRGCR